MAFCLLRIVISPELFELRLKELKSDNLIPRDYKDSVIEDAFEKVRSITREKALENFGKTTNNQKNKGCVVVPLDCNPCLSNQNMALRKKPLSHEHKKVFPKGCFSFSSHGYPTSRS